MGTVRVTSWYPKFSGSHFGLPPCSIHEMTGLGGKIVWTVTYSRRPHFPLPPWHSLMRVEIICLWCKWLVQRFRSERLRVRSATFTPSAHVRRQYLPVWPPMLYNYLYLYLKEMCCEAGNVWLKFNNVAFVSVWTFYDVYSLTVPQIISFILVHNHTLSYTPELENAFPANCSKGIIWQKKKNTSLTSFVSCGVLDERAVRELRRVCKILFRLASWGGFTALKS